MIFSKVRVHIERRGFPVGGQIDPQSVQFYISTFETTPSYLYQVHSTQYVSYLDPLNMMIFSKIRVPMVKGGPRGRSNGPYIVHFYINTLNMAPFNSYQVHSKSYKSYLHPLNLTIFSKIRVPMLKRGVPVGGQMDSKRSNSFSVSFLWYFYIRKKVCIENSKNVIFWNTLIDALETSSEWWTSNYSIFLKRLI